MNRHFMNRLMPYMFLAPAAIILSVALIYPLGYMMYGSFLDWNPSQSISEAEFVGFKNYVTLFYDPFFRKSFSVTLTFAFFVVVLEMVCRRRAGAAAGSKHSWHVRSADAVYSSDDDRPRRGGFDVALYVPPQHRYL